MTKILSDHIKRGKKLIPPFLAMGTHVDVSWVNKILPEIIWLAIINEKIGNKDGAEISRLLIESASNLNKSDKKIYAYLSSYENIDNGFKENLINNLKHLGILSELKDCLSDFLCIYPKCPLTFILEK
jgi:hypothetical protein